MSQFKLSQRSLKNLEGLDPPLIAVIKRAIELTTVDFAVIEGLRTLKRQEELVAAKASQTMASKHLDGIAVDLMAYVDGKGSWDLKYYSPIADAVKQAATELKVPMKWGAAWNVNDITKWPKTMEEAKNHYISERKSQGRKPFIDAVHFELI